MTTREEHSLLLRYILDDLADLKARVRVLETSRSTTSSSSTNWWGNLIEAIPVIETLVSWARKIPWGLVAFGLMTGWQLVAPAVRRLFQGLGLG